MPYNPINYAYSIGRIRVLESRLLNRNEVERMLGAKDAKEAYRVLNDLDYSNHVGDIENVVSFQEVINAGLREVKEMLTKITPYKEVLNILWYRYDFHNIRTLIRAKANPMDEGDLEDNYLLHIGSYSHNLLQKYIFERHYGEQIEDSIKQTILSAEKLYSETKDTFLLDVYLDQQFFKLIAALLKKVNNSFLNNYLSISIDIANLNTSIRIKKLEQKSKNLEDILISGGNIKIATFLEHTESSDDQFLETIKFTPYHEAIATGLEYFKETNSFLELEKGLENLVVEHMKKAKIIAFGPEPLLAYFWAKKNNSQIIRTIMIGKINGIEEEHIRKRLRELYI